MLECVRVVCCLRANIYDSGRIGKVEMSVFNFAVKQKYFANIVYVSSILLIVRYILGLHFELEQGSYQ